MSSWFNLTLDTTPPVITIITNEVDNTLSVRVFANEPIDTALYEATVTDIGTNEYVMPLTWNSETEEFEGSIDTSGFVGGTYKFDVTIYDLVHNVTSSYKELSPHPSTDGQIVLWKTKPMMGNFNSKKTKLKYLVTFKNYNGTILKEEEVFKGQDATPPANPSRTGYNFTGWDVSYTNVQGHLTVTAQYSIKTYTVTFKDWDGDTLKTQVVTYGSNASPPSSPSRTGYNFTGWSGSYTNVTYSRTITATYSIKTYTVTWKDWDGSTLKTESVNHGSNGSPPSTPSRPGWTFNGWSGDYTGVTSSRDIWATYLEDTYRVRWYDWDGDLLRQDFYAYGETVTIPSSSISSKPGGDFEWGGWNCISGPVPPAGWYASCSSSEDFQASWYQSDPQ